MLNKKVVKELENTCLAQFEKAESMLMEAENLMISRGRSKLGGKSEIRLRFEQFESNLDLCWKIAFEEHNVKHVYALPILVYRRIVENNIQKPKVELMMWLIKEAAKLKDEAKENPYVIAGVALYLAYPDPEKENDDSKTNP
jgi:hypothetical protein